MCVVLSICKCSTNDDDIIEKVIYKLCRSTHKVITNDGKYF